MSMEGYPYPAEPITIGPGTATIGLVDQGAAGSDPWLVEASSLPLPSNAAQETGGNLATIAGKDFATQTTLAALNAKVTACNTGAVVISSGTITNITNSVAVTGTFWQATQPVSLASVPSHAVTNAGAFVVQENGAALTALQLIDDVVFAEDVGHTTGDKGVQVLTVRKNTAAATSGSDGDYQPPITNTRGAMWIAVEDGAGGQITSFGGGTQYTEDVPAATDPIGTALNLIRADTLSGLTSANGDNVAARGTDKGELYVKHADDVVVANFDARIGSLTETAPGTDTASSGLNGRLQRIAQTLTSMASYTRFPNPGVLMGSASRSGDQASSSTVNKSGTGVYIFLDVTAVPGGGQTLALYLQAQDPSSGNWVFLHTALVAISAIGTFGFEFHPGASGDTTVALNDTLNRKAISLPSTWRVYCDFSGAGAFTFSVGFVYLP